MGQTCIPHLVQEALYRCAYGLRQLLYCHLRHANTLLATLNPCLTVVLTSAFRTGLPLRQTRGHARS
ncbi:hypothetical protein HRUBRA_02673 [Pseudohaliea rubra DSM 19751]|uniref:Uncharacterized protein n=1 Tax=Pseudohaliea rubra DSM 19751 TaxID=1265313 RepID=A0A095VMV3_9GAMM|nr:hypothetical protein HRUBRA_02673 [Pseudohaliea rubra DSM 19751]